MKYKREVLHPKQYCSMCNRVRTNENKDHNCDYYVGTNVGIDLGHDWQLA